MPDRDPPRLSELDDWFAGLDNEAPATSNRAAGAETRDATSEASGAPDDWVYDEPPPPRVEPAPSEGFTVRLGTLLAVGGVVLVLLVVAGLAVGGVFSGGGKKGGNNPTTTPPATTTQTQSTPATTTTPPPPAAVAAPATTLKPGDQGVQVKRLQRALLQLGYAAGAVDGDYGASTEAALTRFQKATALTADGVLGPATLRALKRALAQHAK
jgi:hypothetical protein